MDIKTLGESFYIYTPDDGVTFYWAATSSDYVSNTSLVGPYDDLDECGKSAVHAILSGERDALIRKLRANGYHAFALDDTPSKNN